MFLRFSDILTDFSLQTFALVKTVLAKSAGSSVVFVGVKLLQALLIGFVSPTDIIACAKSVLDNWDLSHIQGEIARLVGQSAAIVSVGKPKSSFSDGLNLVGFFKGMYLGFFEDSWF
jgi:hypothetical protein